MSTVRVMYTHILASVIVEVQRREILEVEGMKNKQVLMATSVRPSQCPCPSFITSLFSLHVNPSGPHPGWLRPGPLTSSLGPDSDWSSGAAY